MGSYRRNRMTGGRYFLYGGSARQSKKLLMEHIDSFREVIGHMGQKFSFVINAMVNLLYHLRVVWTLP